MQIKEAAHRLGITPRMLRHYEKAGLMDAHRGKNGYRTYTDSDLRRAERIRDLIAAGFSTREVRSMAPCLADENAGPCEGGIIQLLKKLEHIELLMAELTERREVVLERLATLRGSLSTHGSDTPAPKASHESFKASELSDNGVLSASSPLRDARRFPVQNVRSHQQAEG